VIPALLAGLALMAPGPAPQVDHGVVFADRGGVRLRMDVHRPAGLTAVPAPAIVWIHGGGFHSGRRAEMEFYTRFFAREGFVAATIDYRLRSHAEVRRFGYGIGEPEALEDADAAIDFLRARAGAFGLDPARIYVGGSSAGAITALNVATMGTPVAGAIALAGYGHPSAIRRGDPPLLLVHGTADTAVPFSRSLEVQTAAQAAGVPVVLEAERGATHRTLLGRRQPNATRALQWVRQLSLH
jgi:acetyl esterase/lipase